MGCEQALTRLETGDIDIRYADETLAALWEQTAAAKHDFPEHKSIVRRAVRQIPDFFGFQTFSDSRLVRFPDFLGFQALGVSRLLQFPGFCGVFGLLPFSNSCGFSGFFRIFRVFGFLAVGSLTFAGFQDLVGLPEFVRFPDFCVCNNQSPNYHLTCQLCEMSRML